MLENHLLGGHDYFIYRPSGWTVFDKSYVTAGLGLTTPGRDLRCSTQFPHGRLTDTRHKQRKI